MHQNAPNCIIYKKVLGGACPQTPLAKRMASPCAACRFATCKFPNLKKKFLAPPLPNPGDAPDMYLLTINVRITMTISLYLIYLAKHDLKL